MGFLTQAVHNYVRFNSCSEGNIRQELRHFTSYLIEAYSLSLVAVHEGSVVIVLGCHTLEGQFQECIIYKKYMEEQVANLILIWVLCLFRLLHLYTMIPALL